METPVPKKRWGWFDWVKLLGPLVALILYVSFMESLFGRSRLHIFHEVLGLCGYFFGTLALIFVVLFTIQVYKLVQKFTRQLAQMPEAVSLRSIDPRAEFPAADHQQATALGNSLEGLGFQQLFSYTFAQEEPLAGSSANYSAIYYHPTHQCYAHITQLSSPEGISRVTQYAFTTYFSDEWSLSSGIPMKTFRFPALQPRVLATSYPDTGIEEVLQRHLSQSSRMMQELGLTLLPVFSFAEYSVQHNKNLLALKKGLCERGALRILLIHLYRRWFRIMRWDGEYAHAVKQKRMAEKASL